MLVLKRAYNEINPQELLPEIFSPVAQLAFSG